MVSGDPYSFPHKNSAERERIMKWRGRFLAPVISTAVLEQMCEKAVREFFESLFCGMMTHNWVGKSLSGLERCGGENIPAKKSKENIPSDTKVNKSSRVQKPFIKLFPLSSLHPFRRRHPLIIHPKGALCVRRRSLPFPVFFSATTDNPESRSYPFFPVPFGGNGPFLLFP